MRAAVVRQLNDKVDVVSNMEVAEPGPGQVKMKIHATGVCHSDLSGLNGTIPMAVPFVLGHEGAGEIVAVGEGVRRGRAGAPAICAWTPRCFDCDRCLNGEPQLCLTGMAQTATPTLSMDGQPVSSFAGVGTFAEEIIPPETAAIK